MKNRHGCSLGLAVLLGLTACGSGAVPAPTTPPTAPGDPSPTQGIQNIWDLPPFAPLEPGTYFIDPDLDPSTPLRVVYEVPFEGWSM